MTAVALGPKNLSRTRIQGSLIRIVNAEVSWSPASQIDWPKSVFLQTKATHFETMMTTVDEVNRDKTKVPYFFFRNIFFRNIIRQYSLSLRWIIVLV